MSDKEKLTNVEIQQQNIEKSIPVEGAKNNSNVGKILIGVIAAVAVAGGIFAYMVLKPVTIVPVPAQIEVEDTATVMMGENTALDIVVKSDVDLGQMEMPDTKTVLGMEFPAKYEIQEFNYDVVLSSADEAILTIADSSLVAVSCGKVKVSVKSGDVVEEIDVTVKQFVSPAEMPESIEVVKDKTAQLVSDLGEFDVLKAEFTVENSEIAAVDDFGTVTGINQGTTSLTTKTDDGVEHTTSVKVLQPVYDLNVADKSVYVGSTVKSNVGLVPKGADYGTELTYKSSDDSIATVNSSGVITGKKAGNATITVTSEQGIEKQFVVKVSNKPVAQPPATSGGSTSGGGTSAPSTSGGSVPTIGLLSDGEIAAICAAGNARFAENAAGPIYEAADCIPVTPTTYNDCLNAVLARVRYWNSIQTPGACEYYAPGYCIIIKHY